MGKSARKPNVENYEPMKVPHAYKVITGQSGRGEESGLTQHSRTDAAAGFEPDIDLMTLVQLPARDLARTVRFYTDVLGFAPDYPDRPIQGNTFLSTIPRIGPGLHLLETPDSEFRHLHSKVNGELQEYAALHVKSLDELYKRLREAEAPIVREPSDGYMTFLDPEGHLIGVYERRDSEINRKFESNVTGFRHVQMLVTDLEQAAAFLTEALGFRRFNSLPQAASVYELAVKEGHENQPFIRLVRVSGEDVEPMHWILEGRPKHALELHSKNIRALRERIVHSGGAVNEELEYTACGGYLKFYTPDGHYLWVNQDRSYYEDSGSGSENESNPESYRPNSVPKAFIVLQGNSREENKEDGKMKAGLEEITIVERPMMKAVVLRTIRNGRSVREAWAEIEKVMTDHPDWLNKDEGLVFIPEWQWPTGVETLWVGVEVASFDRVPEGFETMTIPARKFAKTTVHGNREQMDRTYDALWKWFDREGHERDMSEGVFGYELNRLTPVNGFHIPADVIDEFDFDIYAPIKSRVEHRHV